MSNAYEDSALSHVAGGGSGGLGFETSGRWLTGGGAAAASSVNFSARAAAWMSAIDSRMMGSWSGRARVEGW